MSRSPKLPKIDVEERFLAQVAWAYHFEGLTQGQVAEKLNVTRLRVNKALAEARKNGLVRITLNTFFSACPELEEKLCSEFGLTEAYVAPSPSRPEDLQMIVGAALGQMLSNKLADTKVKRFGLTWGNTLNLATRFVASFHRQDLEIISVMGGLTRGSDFNSFEITTRLADLLGAQHSYFPAPLYAGSRQSRDTIMKLDVFNEVLAKIRKIDGMAVACSDISLRSLLVRDGLPHDIKTGDLIKAGAVGDVLGVIIDKKGNPIDHSINERVVGIGLDDMRRIPNTILAAGGSYKIPVINAILRKGLARVVVTDENSARSLLSFKN
jgi:DNA-binding transcriptional regulator LsrR (DeoR family)